MLAATHAITGAIIAKVTPDPILGYALALASHPLLDYLPHWDLRTRHSRRPLQHTVVISLVDAGIGFFLGFLIAGNSIPPLRLLTTMFVAQLPDWLEAPYVVFGWKFPPFSWIKSLQHTIHKKLPFPDGIYTQLILIFLLLLLSK